MKSYSSKGATHLWNFSHLQKVPVDRVAVTLISLLVALHLSVGIPSAWYDSDKDPFWRMQQHWDETQTSLRADSILKYGYSSQNLILPPGLPTVYLSLAALGQYLVPGVVGTQSRIIIWARLLATFSWALLLIFSWKFLRRFLDPLPALWAWSLFVGGSGAYIGYAYVAKEDMFCLLLLLGALWNLLSFGQLRELRFLYFAAAFIGVGGATKEYPLLLSPVILLILWDEHRSVSVTFKKLVPVALFTAIVWIGCNPNHYWPLSQLKGIYHEYVATSQVDETAAWPSIRNVFWNVVILRYRLYYLIFAVLLFLKWKGRKGAESSSFRLLSDKLFYLILFLAFYYATSIYKQNYYASVRYFLVGEMAFVILAGICLQEILAMRSDLWKRVAVLTLIVASYGFSWHSGNFNYSYTTRMRAEGYDVNRKPTYVEAQAEVQQKPGPILSSWYVYLPQTFPVTYAVDLSVGADAGYVLLDSLSVSYVRERLSGELIQKRRPKWVLSSSELLEVDRACVQLRKKVLGREVGIPSNYLSAVWEFHRRRLGIVDETALPSGNPVYLYEFSGC